MSGQHCENYDVKRETVHCYPRNVDRCCTWSLESQPGFQILLLFCFAIKQIILLWSWLFSRNSTPIHWLVHGQMTSNNETVSRQMPWAGNIAKTVTSNGKQFTVTRSTVDCWPLLHVMAGISARFSNFAFVLFLLYNKSLNDWSLGEKWISFPSNLNVSLDFVTGNIEILRKQNSLFPSGPVIKCLLLYSWRCVERARTPIGRFLVTW